MASHRHNDTGFVCLAMLARLLGIATDIAQLKHQAGGGASSLAGRDVVRLARALGLRAREISSQWSRLERAPLPAIAQHTDGHYFVLAGVDNAGVLIHDPLDQRPTTLTPEAFASAWSGRLILIGRRHGIAEEKRRFDFSWFVPPLVKYRALVFEVLLASFFIQLFALVTPLFFQVVIDKVLVHRGMTTLDVLAIGLLVVAVFEVLLGGLRNYVFSHTTNRIDVELGTKLFRHLLALPMSYFEARRVGDSVARVRELETIRNFVTGSAVTVAIDLLFTGVFLSVMYYYSPTLCWVVLGAIPCYALLSILITPLFRARLREKFNRGAENQAFLVESISGIETLKAMAVEPQMQRRWEDQLAHYVSAAFRATNLGNIASQIAGLINKVTIVLILWLGARLVIEGALSVGQLIAFNMLAARVSAPVLRLVQLWQDFQQAGISMQRLGDILNTEPERMHNPTRTTIANLDGHVTFENVTFRYHPDRPPVLRAIDLQVSAGEVVGIVGRSGSGKSTFAKLLQRLHVPESGRVLVDGIDLATVDPAWLRRQVGLVLQENVLFRGTVRDNIALTDEGAPGEAIIHAAQLAGAHEFILNLAQGYDTVVGEHGCNLSGGQRQRIAIARALFTNPRILILDEATSALDYESERIIQKNMREICQGRTVFIIAHRLSALRTADRIIVIEHGSIEEQGSHEELISRGARYASLYAHQSGRLSVV